MTLDTRILFRRVTGLLAVSWALLAIGLSLMALFSQAHRLSMPFQLSLITGAAVVEFVTPAARRAGIEVGDRVLEIDGIPAMEAMRFPILFERGWPNLYAMEKSNGRVLDASLLPMPSSLVEQPMDGLLQLGLLGVAIFYLVVAGLVWWGKPDRDDTWALLLFSCAASVLVSTSVRADMIPWSAARAVANLPLLGATSFHLFTTYPVEPSWLARWPRIRVLPYIVALLISTAVLAGPSIGISAEGAGRIAFFYCAILAVASMSILAAERRRANRAGLGERADLMLAAGVVSFLPGLALSFSPIVLSVPIPWYSSLLSMAFFPLAVSYGMIRRQLFDFRLAARSSATYGTASLLVTGGFAFLIAFTDEIVLLSGATARWVQILALFLAILAFNPIRERIQDLVDRFFDRDRSRYREAVGEIAKAMVSTLTIEEIRDRILTALTDTMGVRRAMLLLAEEGNGAVSPAAWRGDWTGSMSAVSLGRSHPVIRSLESRRGELARIDFDEESDSNQRRMCWDVYDDMGIELLVPILFGRDLLGVIAVGSKVTGDRIGGVDRQLLQILANQSAIALENAKAFDEIAQLNETLEERVEIRTRELREIQGQLMQNEKLKSLGQLVAGVAHELNNPIGFVHANLQLLEEYMDALPRDGARDAETERIRGIISKLLLRSREGAERVKEIVQDLRTFSRMDQADLQEAVLNEEIDRTLTLMKPRLRGQIEVIRDYAEVPPMRCYPSQLNQVLLNLLMNACDAMPDGGRISIRTRPTRFGVRLDIADNGPGIPPELIREIFDPFFTTKAIGQGTGLGLSISHSIVERHGGRIYAQSPPEGGATFSVELPLDAAATGE